jgi:hypothetical protein
MPTQPSTQLEQIDSSAYSQPPQNGAAPVVDTGPGGSGTCAGKGTPSSAVSRLSLQSIANRLASEHQEAHYRLKHNPPDTERTLRDNFLPSRLQILESQPILAVGSKTCQLQRREDGCAGCQGSYRGAGPLLACSFRAKFPGHSIKPRLPMAPFDPPKCRVLQQPSALCATQPYHTSDITVWYLYGCFLACPISAPAESRSNIL